MTLISTRLGPILRAVPPPHREPNGEHLMKIELKGWKAIAALAVIAAIVGGKFLLERKTLESDAVEVLKTELRGPYLSPAVVGVDVGAMSRAEAEARGQELLGLNRVEFPSIEARGRGDDVVVRVEILVDGKAPPDGKEVRYYRMSHSAITGWRVRGETTALFYYLKLF